MLQAHFHVIFLKGKKQLIVELLFGLDFLSVNSVLSVKYFFFTELSTLTKGTGPIVKAFFKIRIFLRERH